MLSQSKRKASRQASTQAQGKKSERKEQKYVTLAASLRPRNPPPRPMTGLAKRSRVPPVRSSVLNGARTRVTGTEYLATVTGTTTATAGTTLVTQLIGPHSLGVGRLSAFAGLYEKYRFRRFTIRYVPIANATVSGQVMGFFDTDPTEVPSTTSPLSAFQRGVAHFGARSNNVWEDRIFELKDDDPTRLLYTSNTTQTEPSERMVFQARFTLMAASALTAVALGNLYVDYDIEFVAPQLDTVTGVSGGVASMISSGGSCSDTTPLGTAPTFAPGSNVTIAVVSGSFSKFTIPKGTWLCLARISGSVVSAVAMTATSYGALVVQKSLDSHILADGKSGIAVYKYSCTDYSTLTVTATGGTHVVGASYVYIVAMPPDLVMKASLADRLLLLEQKLGSKPTLSLPSESKTPQEFTFVDTPIRSRSRDSYH